MAECNVVKTQLATLWIACTFTSDSSCWSFSLRRQRKPDYNSLTSVSTVEN